MIEDSNVQTIVVLMFNIYIQELLISLVTFYPDNKPVLRKNLHSFRVKIFMQHVPQELSKPSLTSADTNKHHASKNLQSWSTMETQVFEYILTHLMVQAAIQGCRWLQNTS